MDTELDDNWIKKFEQTDKLYQEFYKDNLWYTNLKLLYINRDNEIELIKTDTFLMKLPNYISREEVLQILKRSSVVNDRGYSLLSIIQYNITLEADDVKNFLYSKEADYNYLKVVKNIDAITFEKTINMFQDLNDLIFVFYEKSNQLKTVNQNNMTKKIQLVSSRGKKTIRKRYND
jgi:hypothetical protein